MTERMNFLPGMKHRVLDQNALENGFERLVRESPTPEFFHGHNPSQLQGNRSFVNAHKQPWNRPHLMSQSARPRVVSTSYSYDSPADIPDTFRSPQSRTLSHSYMSDHELSAADMFRSMKDNSANHSSLATDNSLNSTATSREHDTSKENHYYNLYGVNPGGRERNFMSRSTQPLHHREVHEVNVGQNHSIHGEMVNRKEQRFRNNRRPNSDGMRIQNDPELEIARNFIRNSNMAENRMHTNKRNMHAITLPVSNRCDHATNAYHRSRGHVGNEVVDADYPSQRQGVQNIYEDIYEGAIQNEDYEETFQEAFGDSGTANNDMQSNADDDIDSVSVVMDQEPTSLYLWIIKPVPDTQCICVEGKKSHSDENFWHSGIVTERIGEKCVITESGSQYRLMGNMELYDALAAGFTRETVDAFRMGFPSDWRNVIQTDFEGREQISIDGGGQPEPASEDEISVLGNDAASASEVSPEDDDLEIEVTELNGDVEITENCERIITAAGPDGGMLTVTDIGYGSQTEDNIPVVRTDMPKEHVLSKWLIKPLATGKGICVVGIKHNSLLWHSSAIEARLGKKRLKTASGSLYRLKGKMDKIMASEEDVPEAIIKAFHTGFPKEWQELVQEHFKFTDCASTLKRSSIKKSGRRAAPKSVSARTRSAYSANHTGTGSKATYVSDTTPDYKGGVTVNQKKKLSSTGKKSSNSVKKNKSITSSAVEEDIDEQIVYTPCGEMVDLESLGRSRSGRLIKPRLQWWTGQKVAVTDKGLAITGVTQYAAKYLQEIGDRYKGSPALWQRQYWNPVGSDRDVSINSVSSKSSHNMSRTLLATSEHEKQKSNSKTAKQHNSALKTAALTADSKQDSKVRKEKNSVEASTSKNGEKNGVTAVVVLPQLDDEVMNVLKDAKSKRTTKPTKHDTCYSRSNKKKDKHVHEFDLNDTKDSEVVDAKCLSKNLGGNNEVTTGKGNNENVNDSSTEESETSNANGYCRKLQNVKTSDKIKAGDKDEYFGQSKYKSRIGVKIPTSIATVDHDSDVQLMEHPSTRARKCKRRARLEIISEAESEEDSPPVKRPVRKRKLKSGQVVNTRGRCRRLEVLSEEEDSDSDEKYVPIETRHPRKTRSSRADGSLDTKEGKDNAGPTDHWTKEEKSRLFSACKELDPNHPHYWRNVADTVRTKTEEACQEMYYGPCPKPESAKKSATKPPKDKPKATAITARAGTMKRKQQLRDILDQHNHDYNDDIFDSTPFKNTRKRKVPQLEDEDEDAIFEEVAKRQGKARFETPLGAGMMTHRGCVAFASEKKTPASNLNLDMLEENPDAVSHVHKILQRRKMATRKQKFMETPKPTKVALPVDDDSPQKRLFHEYLREERDVTDNHKDSDMEEDYYWDDDVAAH